LGKAFGLRQPRKPLLPGLTGEVRVGFTYIPKTENGKLVIADLMPEIVLLHHPLVGEGEMPDPEYVDPKQLRPGPIRHESLPPALLAQIKAVFDVIGPFLGTTLEQFEIGFMRDAHPQGEIALWFRITKAWLAYHEDYLENRTLPDEEERKLLGALVAISTGVEDVSKLNVPAEVARRLVQCYENPTGH
jgi:hypothetical protein